jgi:hypothetical protein
VLGQTYNNFEINCKKKMLTKLIVPLLVIGAKQCCDNTENMKDVATTSFNENVIILDDELYK